MHLLPVPKKIQIMQENYILPFQGEIVLEASCSASVYGYAVFLQRYLEQGTGFAYGITAASEKGPVVIREDVALSHQEYRLEIGEQIIITGGSSQGILYGIQTLGQILLQKGAALPRLVIEDWPDFESRGFFHDVTRGRVPKMEWLKQLADTMCRYKMNQLQLYVEHSFLFSGLSEMWRDDTPLTAEDILELDRYCVERGIELVPALSSFGHLYKLLSTKQYREFCELENAGTQAFSFIDRMQHHTLDVSNQEGIALIRRMIKEYLPLFSSKKFNICGDETFDLGRGKNRSRMEQEGKARLYMSYVGSLCRFIVEQGSTPMLWGDVMLEFPELASELPEKTICLNWGYDPKQTEDSARIYAGTGIRQYVCPGTAGWNKLVNLQEDSWENIRRMCGYGLKYRCEGVLNTDWGDFGHINHPPFSIPGLIYGAAASWNYGNVPEYETLNRDISLLEYRDGSGQMMKVTDLLSKQECFGWEDLVTFRERWYPAGDSVWREELEKRRERIAGFGEKQDAIGVCIRELSQCMGQMETERRKAVYAYLLAAEGMKLFNKTGWLLLQLADGNRNRAEMLQTANQLEEWYYRYRKLWRTLSRESELYRIGEIINWYADFLR